MHMQKVTSLILEESELCQAQTKDIWKQMAFTRDGAIRTKRQYGGYGASKMSMGSPPGSCCACTQGMPGPRGPAGEDGDDGIFNSKHRGS
ncbi:hypothetical protein WR25_14532 [Diploscapter pachys]|uniref:Nematode cuticle collagen N-terminal domain-containing protein n=1 Tax=Diploscapter pachys TaxID=2018661 RepID=A0A2A2JUH1_9BILA|nr:hypothetical protein WR25_14532 [Diploscapter pachys]